MATPSASKRIWGWYFFDFASQPYNTLLLTFVFAPYFATVVGDPAKAQEMWGWTLAAAGFVIAILAPILGAIADTTGRRMPWIVVFSVLYVAGSAALWFAYPGMGDVWWILALFALGLVGMEFATIFTNAMLPGLGPKEEIGRISGSGWAFGYVGGLVSLVVVLLYLAENADGVTLLGRPPAFGLDPETREGTRLVGPLTAAWYVVFMIPFFAWVREVPPAAPRQEPLGASVRQALADLGRTLRLLPRRQSLMAFLLSSMFYRDALNGFYTFGGIYAHGVLEWSVVDVGVFGILAVIAGAVFAWVGGRIDRAFGPKPVIAGAIATLTIVAVAVVLISRESVFGLPVGPGSHLPDIAFYVCGILVGAAGGMLQASSRTMLVRQADPARMTEAFGLYALTGKATSFLAPASIAAMTAATGSQVWGVSPLIALFLLSAWLLRGVDPEGEGQERWSPQPGA